MAMDIFRCGRDLTYMTFSCCMIMRCARTIRTMADGSGFLW